MKYLIMGLISAITLIAGGALPASTWIGVICIISGASLMGHIAAVAASKED